MCASSLPPAALSMFAGRCGSPGLQATLCILMFSMCSRAKRGLGGLARPWVTWICFFFPWHPHVRVRMFPCACMPQIVGPSVYTTYLNAAKRLGLSEAAAGYWVGALAEYGFLVQKAESVFLSCGLWQLCSVQHDGCNTVEGRSTPAQFHPPHAAQGQHGNPPSQCMCNTRCIAVASTYLCVALRPFTSRRMSGMASGCWRTWPCPWWTCGCQQTATSIPGMHSRVPPAPGCLCILPLPWCLCSLRCAFGLC